MPIYDLTNNYKVQCFNEYVASLKKKGRTVKLEVVTRKRTLDQNALHWYWLKVIEKETGNKSIEMHMLYRANFLPKTDEYITEIIRPELWAKIKVRIKSFHYFKGLEDIIDVISESTASQETDTKKMMYFMDNIKHHAKEAMGILLLTKKEEGYPEFINEYR